MRHTTHHDGGSGAGPRHGHTTERKRVYLPFLDGMRALAAAFVVAHHLWQYAALSGQVPPAWFEALSVLKYGTYGVAVFLVISGYCLMLPIARRPEARLPRALVPFAARRAERLLPAYFLVLVASIALIAAVPALRAESGTPWDITLPSLTFGSITSHALLVHNWFEAWRWTINPPMWSIALELQIYLVFAIALLPLVRAIGVRWTAVVAFVASIALAGLGFGFAHPWMLGLFALGMVCAQITAGGREGSSYDTLRLIAAGAAVTLATVGTEALGNGVVGDMFSEVTVGAATAVVIVVLASTGRAAGSLAAWTAAVLSWGPLRAMGRSSYSLYLVHYPIVAAVYLTVIREQGWSVPISLAALTAVSVPVIATTTAVVYYAAERPFLRRPAPQPAGAANEPCHGSSSGP